MREKKRDTVSSRRIHAYSFDQNLVEIILNEDILMTLSKETKVRKRLEEKKSLFVCLKPIRSHLANFVDLIQSKGFSFVIEKKKFLIQF